MSAFFSGRQVIVHGLQSRADLNGKSGNVVEILANGRIKVKIATPINANDQYIAVKPENLNCAEEVTPNPSWTQRQSGPEVVPLICPIQNIWLNGGYFYPFGNVPAKRLTSYLPPDQGMATILLLGCGDFRHILFTNWCHEQAGGIVRNQTHHIVACDIKASIMARNIILLKLMVDNNNSAMMLNKMWMIFYSKFLDTDCLELLKATATSLLALSGGSDHPHHLSVKRWNQSEFGKMCQFVDHHSFQQVCEMWRFYERGVSIGSRIDRNLKTHERTLPPHLKDAVLMSSVLHSDPCLTPAIQNMMTHNNYTKSYLQGKLDLFQCVYPFAKGVTKENLYSNPMMLEGDKKDKVYLHYNIDPPSGFHSCLAYGPLQNTERVLPDLPSTSMSAAFTKVTTDSLTKVAYAEFCLWCKATKERINRNLLVIQVYVGDAFDFCHGLIARRVAAFKESMGESRRKGETTGDEQGQSLNDNQNDAQEFNGLRYVAYNGLLTIDQDTVPVEFDVIDTSNIADHCRLLNVLLYCKALMKRNLHSTLFTENISSHCNESSFSKIMEQWFGIDVETFTILTGLVPMDYPVTSVASLKTRSVMAVAPMEGQGLNMHLRWKLFDHHLNNLENHHNNGFQSTLNVKISMSMDDFVTTFMNIYKKLFQPLLDPLAFREYFTKQMEGGITKSKLLRVMANDYNNPTAQCYALLVRHAVDRLLPLPPGTICKLLYTIRFSRFMMQGNVFQDLLSWFAQYQLLTRDEWKAELDDVFKNSSIEWNSAVVRNMIGDRTDVSLMLVTLLVPKSAIDAAVGALHCPIIDFCISGRYENIYQSFHVICLRQNPAALSNDWSFDNIIVNGMVANSTLPTMEDCEWLACSCIIPLSSLTFDDPTRINVMLRFNNSAMKQEPQIMSRLGPRMAIFQVPLSDRTHVSYKPLAVGTNPFDLLLTLQGQQRAASNATSSRHTPTSASPDCSSSMPSNSSSTNALISCDTLQFMKGSSGSIPILTVKVNFDDANADFIKSCSPLLKQLPKPNEVALIISLPQEGVPLGEDNELRYKLVLPMPIDIDKSRIQISRSKGFMNLLVLPFSSKTTSIDRFAHIFIDKKRLRSTSSSCEHYTLYGTSYCLLDILPEANISKKNDLTSWFMTLVGVGMTEAERTAQKVDDNSKKTAIGSWKESVHALLHHFTTQMVSSKKAFSLKGPENGVEIILYINALKVDYAIDRSVVLDIAVCALELETVSEVASWYMLEMEQDRCEVNVTAAEMKFWKRMLPGLIERVRNQWHHDPAICEYTQHQRIPLSDKSNGEKVICSCCLGKQLDGTPFMNCLKEHQKGIASKFARAAIPLIYTID